MPSTLSGQERLLRVIIAIAVVGGPLGYLLGGALEPAAHTTGTATIAANAAADPVINAAHLVAFVLAGYLLPIGVAGLARLAGGTSSWSATIGGLLGVVGWLPFSALTALDELPRVMAGLPQRAGYPTLYDRFAYGTVMNGYLLVYIVGHLLAYVVLGISLSRTRAVPQWAAWAIVASSPLIMIGFALRRQLGEDAGFWIAVGSTVLLVLGSVPAARALLRGPADERPVSGVRPVAPGGAVR